MFPVFFKLPQLLSDVKGGHIVNARIFQFSRIALVCTVCLLLRGVLLFLLVLNDTHQMGLPFNLILLFVFGYFLLGKALPAAAVLYYLHAADPEEEIMRASQRSINGGDASRKLSPAKQQLKLGQPQQHLGDVLLPRKDSCLEESLTMSEEVGDLQAYLASTRQFRGSGSDSTNDNQYSPRIVREQRGGSAVGTSAHEPMYRPPRKLTS